jgi:ABC-type transport system involved in multi-copper enzyme maturation permease subunit
MIVLPILERELRLASRRKATYRLRLWTSLVGFLLCFLLVPFTGVLSGNPAGGQIIFKTLTTYAFALALSAGIFLTAQAIADEKRDGTIGLLFLTDLRSHDLVVGKFVSCSLNAFYCLLALFPVMALPFLMGGVTAGEFWRMTLALANALFFSLATGLTVSALSRDSQQAMTRTLCALLFLVLGPIALEQVWSGWKLSWFGWLARGIDPLYPLRFAFENQYQSDPRQFESSLVVSNVVAWLGLLVTSWRLFRWCQDEPSVARRSFFRSRLFPYFGPAKKRRRILAANPVAWLAGRNSMLRILVWIFVLLLAVISYFTNFDLPSTRFVWWTGPEGIALFVIKVLAAFQACRFFVELRRSSLLEQLLCTPLTNSQIIRGQWQAFWRVFFLPCAVIFGILGLFCLPYFSPFSGGLAAMTYGVDVTRIVPRLYQLAKLVADLFAVGWVGMWLALSTRRPNFAASLTVLWVLIFPSLLFCVPDPLIDAFFITWAANRLEADLRKTIRKQFYPTINYRDRPLPPRRVPAPPVLR